MRLHDRSAGSSSSYRLLGAVGSVMLFVGVFTPILSEPLGFSRNYISYRAIDGFVVIAAAIVAFIGSLACRRGLLALAGITSVAALGVTFISIHRDLRRAKTELLALTPPAMVPPFDKVSGSLDKAFRQLADAAVDR